MFDEVRVHEGDDAVVVVLHHRVPAPPLRSEVAVMPPARGSEMSTWDRPPLAKREECVAKEVLVAVAQGEEELPAGKHVRDEDEHVQVASLADEELTGFGRPFVAALHAEYTPNSLR